MDVRSLIVREYLASLKESDELDYVFPLFLESQGFIILSKPSEYKGMPQYGKDVVAVGVDFKDNVKKRFYFELKGGEDRHIDTNVYTKKDGVRESLLEAKDKDFDFINKEDEKLPLKLFWYTMVKLRQVLNLPLRDLSRKTFQQMVMLSLNIGDFLN